MLIYQLGAIISETHFDMTVTLGNLLTIIAFAIAAIAFGIRIETRVAMHETWIKAHAECNAKQIEILNEVRSAIAYIRGRSSLPERCREED